MGFGLGLAGLILGVITVFSIYPFNLFLIWASLLCCSIAAGYRDGRGLAIATWIVCAASLLFLSPLTLAFLASSPAPPPVVVPTIVMFGLPIVVAMTKALFGATGRRSGADKATTGSSTPTAPAGGAPDKPERSDHGTSGKALTPPPPPRFGIAAATSTLVTLLLIGAAGYWWWQGRPLPWTDTGAPSLSGSAEQKESVSPSSVSSAEEELAAWKSLGSNPSRAELEAFLRAFPDGTFADLARAKLEAMQQRSNSEPLPTTPTADPEPVPVGNFRDCDECPEMVTVPAGSFVMGSPADEEGRRDDEGPQRTVTIGRAFAVGKFEVTFAEWDACVAGGGCNGYRPEDQGWGRGNRPVINVSWNDAQAYVQWLSNRTGKRYRLLSEAEWEYAARARTTTAYPWDQSASHESANYGMDLCCGGLAQGSDSWLYTAPVGSFPANGFGLYDMHGNVLEWTEDCYNGSYAGASSDGSAPRSGDCSIRVLRGGSWFSLPRGLRSAFRAWNYPTARDVYNGFRLARTL